MYTVRELDPLSSFVAPACTTLQAAAASIYRLLGCRLCCSHRFLGRGRSPKPFRKALVLPYFPSLNHLCRLSHLQQKCPSTFLTPAPSEPASR